MESEAGIEAAGRLRKSCEFCREVKGRCLPSQNDTSRCLRCVREGKKCIVLRAKARPKKEKVSKTRVGKLEAQIEHILDRLSSNEEVSRHQLIPRDNTWNATGPYTLPANTTFDIPIKLPPSFSNIIFDGFQDVISKGLVSFEQAVKSLNAFQTQASSFPFVVVDPTIDLDILRRKRPFLLLSILTFAAGWNTPLQSELEYDLKETICKKVIMNGEKSLDILQGLLVYLNWYHFHFDPQRQQLYLLTQMAGSMAIDLGLDKPTRQELPTHPAWLIPQLRLGMRLPPEEVEGRRAVLGCYYLSSAISSALRKPSILLYSAYLGDSSRLLADIGAAKSDAVLPCFVHLQRLQEEAKRGFQYDEVQPHQADLTKTEAFRQRFEAELIELRISFQAQFHDSAKLLFCYYAVKIYVREIGLHANPPSAFSFETEASSLQSWFFSAERHNSLLDCLTATKEFLHHFLSLSAEEVFALATPDLLRLLYAVLILARFSAGPDAPLLNEGVLSGMTKLTHYLSAIVGKLSHVLADLPTPSDHYLYSVSNLFENSMKWHGPAIAGTGGLKEDLFDAKPARFKAEEMRTTTEVCVDIPGGSDACPDLSFAPDKTRVSSDPSDFFVNWETMPTGKD